jgi:serine kinase of HPr protein (carbohydrate metabolism regulator)
LADAPLIVHGTCVALGTAAALLRGDSGSGKSDLALRFLALPPGDEGEPRLIADDQVRIARGSSGELFASPPPSIAGKLEVRGLGIVDVPYRAEARLRLVVDLATEKDVPRMAPDPLEHVTLAGVAVPRLLLAPFESSAPLKLKLALLQAASRGNGAQS